MSWPSDKVLKAPVTEASQRSATEHAHQEVATIAAPKHSSAVAADHSSMPKQGGAPSVATEHSGASQVVSEHSGASQVATEHNVTDQSTPDVNEPEYADEPIRPCAICGTELSDDPPPWECRACNRETCYDCLGRCYQPGCHPRFCSHCLHDHGATEHTSASSLCAQCDSDSTSVGRVNVECLEGLSPKPEKILMDMLD